MPTISKTKKCKIVYFDKLLAKIAQILVLSPLHNDFWLEVAPHVKYVTWAPSLDSDI
jgi:hypothetical protein